MWVVIKGLSTSGHSYTVDMTDNREHAEQIAKGYALGGIKAVVCQAVVVAEPSYTMRNLNR